MSDERGWLLMISSDFPPVSGGQARFLHDLWTSLPPERLVILAPALAGDGEVDARLACRVQRVRLPLGEGRWTKVRKSLGLLRAALALCRRFEVRAIHCGQIFSAGFAGWGCRLLCGVPYYLYAHGADVLEFSGRFPWGWLLRRIAAGSARVVANSEFTAGKVAALGVGRERIAIIHPGIDLERFAGRAKREEERTRRGWQGRQVVLSVGRLVERKGQDRLIEALARLREQVPGVHYAVAGEGPWRGRLEHLARECGVAERVEFLGFVGEADLPALYAAADVFAMVSRQIAARGEVEGFGIVYLEAMACGLPVLAGRSGGVEDAVGHAGLLVDPEDGGAIAAGLGRLLTDQDLRARLAAAGCARVRAFDRRAQAQRLEALLA